MYFLYVDESGDPSELKDNNENSPHFILSGLIIGVKDWENCLQRFKTFRQQLKASYGLALREEIHATELIRVGNLKSYRKIKKKDRLKILENCTTEFPKIFSSSKILNICIDKEEHSNTNNIKELAWKRLIQRYDNFLKKSANGSLGIIICDGIEDREVRSLLRKMRVYNPTPSKFGGYYHALTNNIIEDVFTRDSNHSYFIQAVDVIAHTLYRKEYSKGSLKKYRMERLFNNLEPLLLKEANHNDEQGIVRK